MNYIRLPALVALALTVSACGSNSSTETPAEPGAPIITDFTAEPETVAPGEVSTLTWTVSGDNPTLTIETADSRPITVTGETSYVAQPTVTTTYVLIAQNAAGRVQDDVVVNVSAAEPPEAP